MAFQSSIIAVGAIVLQAALNSLGTDVVAAQAAAGRIDQFANQPMMSFGIAMATFTAQNYGAKEYGRILQGVRQTLLMSVGFSLLAGAIVIFFGHFFVQLFVSPSETRVFELAQTYFNINGSLYWILAVLFILRYTLQGFGQQDPYDRRYDGIAYAFFCSYRSYRNVGIPRSSSSFSFSLDRFCCRVALLLYAFDETIETHG